MTSERGELMTREGFPAPTERKRLRFLQPDPRIAGGDFTDNFSSAVGGMIVEYNYLKIDIFILQNRTQSIADIPFLVSRWNQNGAGDGGSAVARQRSIGRKISKKHRRRQDRQATSDNREGDHFASA